ncbi:extracellular glycoprotein lacritin [Myotis daubentonii]|uniref:extracellular glycoprotein lacritin n=1 Tax=Myotis daubentonii TaxID=98922 RepID=UPI0028738B46|nr:extracellular glycoprotein lacritin [Myotis daubentonii]
MRFTALLLLVALAGALVVAQDATAGPAQAAEDPESLQSDAPQETTIAAQTPAAAQETPAAAQEPTTKQRKNPLESVIEKGRSDQKNVIEREKKKVDDRIQKAKGPQGAMLRRDWI